MRNAVKSGVASDAAAKMSPRQELADYLSAGPIEVNDIVAWWGVSYIRDFIHLMFADTYFHKLHSLQYPTLSKIARDYLAIQGSAVSSERAFSSSAITTTARRNCMLPTTIEALQLLKSGYREGHISASAEAERAVRRAQSPGTVL